MTTNLEKFITFKFIQSLRQNSIVTDFYGENYELSKETRLQIATDDVNRMCRHFWQKLKSIQNAPSCLAKIKIN